MDETRVYILSAATGEMIDHCDGPEPGGRCPYAGGDGIVPCSGCRVAPLSAGPEYWLLFVPPRSRHCPQAWNLEAVGY